MSRHRRHRNPPVEERVTMVGDFPANTPEGDGKGCLPIMFFGVFFWGSVIGVALLLR